SCRPAAGSEPRWDLQERSTMMASISFTRLNETLLLRSPSLAPSFGLKGRQKPAQGDAAQPRNPGIRCDQCGKALKGRRRHAPERNISLAGARTEPMCILTSLALS